jgi:DNA polymerase-3 subunit gamma/tau
MALNCERRDPVNPSGEPCGECPSCERVWSGSANLDVVEIDAASNTGVDDVRALIENAQYMPARGRTKVYLIDEVHMLSKSAFNALLKTLEEPPGHVKFLLATTDPQKLPVTVLSRCLQFNLRRLEQEQIAGQMARILKAEQIDAEPGALALLARAADGSLRDGLSLLDQAIAYTGGKLLESGVNTMLGTVERAQVGELLESLVVADGARLMQAVAEMAQYSPDFGHVLEDLATELHRIQLHQLVPGFQAEVSRVDAAGLAARLAPELVQLWYQMAVTGRRDLGFAPSPRAGFEMALLRMLAFRPAEAVRGEAGKPAASVPASAATTPAATTPAARSAPAAAVASPVPATPAAPVAATARSQPAAPAPVEARPQPAAPIATAAPVASSTPPAALHRSLRDPEDWLALIAASGLKGPAFQLASHCAFIAFADGVLSVHLADEDAHLRSEGLVRQLAQSVGAALGGAVQVRFEAQAANAGDTLHRRSERQRGERQLAAEASFRADPVVEALLGQGGSIVPDSIRPLSEN